MKLLERFAQFEPKPGVDYRRVLEVDAKDRTPMRSLTLGIGGALLAVYGYVWLVAGLPQLVSLVAPGPVFTMASKAIAVALAIPLTMALVLLAHRFNPRWLTSVQPGIRWRYLIAAWLIASVILIMGAIISRMGQPWVWAPENPLWAYLAVVLLLTPLQAAGEEFFFRGYLIQALHSAAPGGAAAGSGIQGWLIGTYQKWFGVVGSALVFAMLHGTQSPALFAHRFGFGLITGWLVVKTGGLEAGIAVHIVNNILTYGVGIFTGTLIQVRSIVFADWLPVAIDLAAFAAFAAVAVWLAKRMNLATKTPLSQFGSSSVPLVR
jgi:uncharacterized protein